LLPETAEDGKTGDLRGVELEFDSDPFAKRNVQRE
jgi:hypothetical protein